MKWILLAVISGVVACLWWLDAEHGTADSRQDPGSTLERGLQGLSLARAYLSEVAGRETALLTRAPAQAVLPDDGVVLRVVPSPRTAVLAAMKEKTGLDKEPSAWAQAEPWLSRGGRLVLAFPGDGEVVTGAATAVLPLLPGVRQVTIAHGRGLAERHLLAASPVLVAGGQVVIARQRVGAGDVWLMSCPELLTNQHLPLGDHSALLLALVGEGRPVWFDEHAHAIASDEGFVTLLRHWGLGPALLLGVLLVVMWFWRGRVLLGPPADPWRDHRAEAVEGVDALAGLYHRALSRRDLIEIYRQRLLREVGLRTGQRPVAAKASVERLTEGLRLPAGALTATDFHRLMNRLTQAFRSLRDEHRRRRP